jgi:alkyl hydroperoxide reductase subunit AhpC
VAKAYGTYAEERGIARRALVMVGPEGVVEWSYESPSPLEIPGANLIFDALDQQRAA